MRRHAKPIGQLLLLIAFIGQWYFLDKLKESDEAIGDASRNYAIARLAGEQYLSMYFQTKDDRMLRKSAREYANALSLILIASGYSSEDLKSSISEIQTESNRINSLDDYNQFIDFVNKKESENSDYFNQNMWAISLKRKVSWGLVFGLSVVGLGLVWWGEFNTTETKKKPISKKTK